MVLRHFRRLLGDLFVQSIKEPCQIGLEVPLLIAARPFTLGESDSASPQREQTRQLSWAANGHWAMSTGSIRLPSDRGSRAPALQQNGRGATGHRALRDVGYLDAGGCQVDWHRIERSCGRRLRAHPRQRRLRPNLSEWQRAVFRLMLKIHTSYS